MIDYVHWEGYSNNHAVVLSLYVLGRNYSNKAVATEGICCAEHCGICNTDNKLLLLS